MLVSGSDGNIYYDSFKGRFTGSLYKTGFIQYNDTEFDDDGETVTEPGILYDTENNQYWLDVRWVLASYYTGSNYVSTFDEDANEGCIWVYDVTNAQKATIENDAQYIAKYVDSNL